MENTSQNYGHIGSDSLTCHPIQVNMPHLNPSQTGRYSIYLPQGDERQSWPWCWLYTEMVYLPAETPLFSKRQHSEINDCLEDYWEDY